MAIGSSVPPRAYTREILTTAFNWLQSQPDSVRTKATTPDALVGLYMQAQRGGAPAPGFDAEAPVSSQAFMSDLKNLAKGLEEFDDSRGTKAVPPPPASRAQLGQAATYPQSAQASLPFSPPFSPPPPAPVSMPASMASARAQRSIPLDEMCEAPVQALVSPATFTPVTTTAAQGGLNERSLQMLRDVQLAMNLTSEVEAMNLMIAVAHKNLKSLLA